MIDSVVDLVEGHVDLDGSQFSESIVERWYFARDYQRNVVVLEFGSSCPLRSPFLIHDHVMISKGFFHSFTKFFIFNVGRIAVMRRTHSRAVLRFCRIKSSNKLLRSFMSLNNIETLTVFR